MEETRDEDDVFGPWETYLLVLGTDTSSAVPTNV
jgi:hypothetical protein